MPSHCLDVDIDIAHPPYRGHAPITYRTVEGDKRALTSTV